MFLGGSKDSDTHLALTDRVRFVAYPPQNSPEIRRYAKKCFTHTKHGCNEPKVAYLDKPPRASPIHEAFIGQLPTSLPLMYVAWAVDLLLRDYGTRWVLQTQPLGGALVSVQSSTQLARLNRLIHTLMFDVDGIWIGETGSHVGVIRALSQAI